MGKIMTEDRSRRAFLAMASAALGPATAGCSVANRGRTQPPGLGTASANEKTPSADDTATDGPTQESPYDTVLDMRADLGCDDTGVRPCDDALERAVGDRTRLEFPPGRYRFEEEHRFERVDDLAIVGTGDTREEVRLVFPSGYSGIVLGLWYGRNWRIENLTVDQSMDRRTGVGLELVPLAGLTITDLEISGFSPYNHNGGQRGLYCDVLEPDGVAVIERYVHRDPCAVGNYPQGVQGFLADEYHRGTLYCRDWHLENCGENGLYASRTPGDVRVEGGLFRNNEVASIRVCGEGSYIKNASVEVDTARAHSGNRGRYENVRGIWWESGSFAASGGFIENCDLRMRTTPISQGLLRIERTAGSVEIRNCRLENETPWATLDAVAPTGPVDEKSTAVTLETTEVRTAGPGRPAIQLDNRPGSSIRAGTILSPHSTRDGVDVERSPDSVIRAGDIRVGRYPVRVRTPAEAGACPLLLSDGPAIESWWVAGELLGPPTVSRDGSGGEVCVAATPAPDIDAVVITGLEDNEVRGLLLEGGSPADSPTTVEGNHTDAVAVRDQR